MRAMVLLLLMQSSGISIPKIDAAEMQKRIVTAVFAYYPDSAKGQKVPDSALIEVVVDERGKVKSAKILESADVLAAAAKRYALMWKFKATGKKYAGQIRVRFTWRKDKGGVGKRLSMTA